MRNKAFRRKQEQKAKLKAKKIIKNLFHVDDFKPEDLDPVRVGIRANSPKLCSCYICGNPRKHLKEKTKQEKIFDSSL